MRMLWTCLLCVVIPIRVFPARVMAGASRDRNSCECGPRKSAGMYTCQGRTAPPTKKQQKQQKDTPSPPTPFSADFRAAPNPTMVRAEADGSAKQRQLPVMPSLGAVALRRPASSAPSHPLSSARRPHASSQGCAARRYAARAQPRAGRSLDGRPPLGNGSAQLASMRGEVKYPRRDNPAPPSPQSDRPLLSHLRSAPAAGTPRWPTVRVARPSAAPLCPMRLRRPACEASQCFRRRSRRTNWPGA